MRFLDRIKLRLLISVQQRPNLRQCAAHYCLHLLHRLLMNGNDLRFRRIEDRLDLRLLVSREVQLACDSLEAERMSLPVPSLAWARLCLHNDKSAKRDRAGGCNC